MWDGNSGENKRIREREKWATETKSESNDETLIGLSDEDIFCSNNEMNNVFNS